jgi:hypothetical protein
MTKDPTIPGLRFLVFSGLLAVSAVSALELRPGPGLLLPSPVMEPLTESRDLLCYHAGAYYFVKIPHPVWGDVGRQYQRITPVGGGLMEGCELRLHNTWNSTNSHNGMLWLGVHRRSGTLPAPPEVLYPFPTDTLTAAIYRFYLPTPDFVIQPDEEVFLSLQFVPATAADTIAIVTAAEGTWTGHSFFLSGNSVTWWGTPQNIPFGDMHFCAEIQFAEGPLPLALMPWQRADLGRLPAGESGSWRFPVYNLGTAPLGTLLEVPGNDHFGGWLDGPDSLLHPDTLFVVVEYEAPGAWIGEVDDSTRFLLHTNSEGHTILPMDLRAGNSTSEILLNDWNEWLEPGSEWELTFTQFADTGATLANWDFYTGLWRPGTFVGHAAPPAGSMATNLLALRDLWVEEGEYVRLRWSQYRRPGNGDDAVHGLAWRNPGTGFWYVQNQVPLDEDPYLGPMEDWYSVPWILWGPCPSSGYHGFGLVYSGSSGDEWFIDDLELNRQPALPAPVAHISVHGSAVCLDWNEVPGAVGYRITLIQGGIEQVVGETSSTRWEHERGLQCTGYRGYRVRALAAPSNRCAVESTHPLPVPRREHGGPAGGLMPPGVPWQVFR